MYVEIHTTTMIKEKEAANLKKQGEYPGGLRQRKGKRDDVIINYLKRRDFSRLKYLLFLSFSISWWVPKQLSLYPSPKVP